MNALYQAIEDAIVSALEDGARLPPDFAVEIPAEDFKWLIALGLRWRRGGSVGHDAASVMLQVGGHNVSIRREAQPDAWVTH